MLTRLTRLLLGIPGSEVLEKDEDSLGDLYRRVITIAWPAALEGLLLTLMNSFDTMMVGKLGAAAIASVGLCAQPRMIMLLVAQALGVGTTAVIARRKGAGDQAAAVSCLKQSMAIITGIGILMTVIGYAMAEPLLKLAGAGEDTLADGVIYFQTISLAFIANCWALCICAAMRGIGKTRITMVVNMTANVVNVFLNYCLIGGHLGFPALGVRGAAIATAVGTCVSCIMALVVVFRKGGYLSLVPFTPVRFDSATVHSLVSVGSGTIAESVFLRLGFLVNGRLIAGVSTAAYATNQIVQQISSLTFTVGDGISSACTSLVGQSLGARKPELAQRFATATLLTGSAVMVFTGACLYLLAEPIIGIFTPDERVIRLASRCLRITAFMQVPQVVAWTIGGILRGAALLCCSFITKKVTRAYSRRPPFAIMIFRS